MGHDNPFAELLMMAPQADRMVPRYPPQLPGETVPVNGRLRLSDAPGFGVELDRSLPLHRPHPHG